MTARVNLLPETTRERDRQASARVAVVVILVVVIAGLGGVYWWLTTEVANAEEELAEARQVTRELEAEEAELAAFADLERLRDLTSDRVSDTLAGEVSVAGFLQDIALVMPGDAQLDSMTATLEDFDPEITTVGTFTMSGKSLRLHAPGVERLLLEFEKAATITDPFLNTSTLDEPDETVVSFSLDGRVTATALTDRYTQGIEEVIR